MTPEKLKVFVNSSGFPLEIGMEHLVRSKPLSRGWKVRYKEHSVQGPARTRYGLFFAPARHSGWVGDGYPKSFTSACSKTLSRPVSGACGKIATREKAIVNPCRACFTSLARFRAWAASLWHPRSAPSI
jgi:hypothetical protein